MEGSLQGWCVAHCLFSLHTKCLTIFPRETKWYQKLLNLEKGQCFVVLLPPHPSTIKSLKMLKRKDCLKIFFSKKKVIVERLIDIRGFTIPIGQWLQQRGWYSLYDFGCRAYGNWVWEFYCNIYDIGQQSFKSFVCGISVEINPNCRSQFLEIDGTLDVQYPIPEPDVDNMDDDDNIDLVLVATTLYGRRRTWLDGLIKQKYPTTSIFLLHTM